MIMSFVKGQITHIRKSNEYYIVRLNWDLSQNERANMKADNSVSIHKFIGFLFF